MIIIKKFQTDRFTLNVFQFLFAKQSSWDLTLSSSFPYCVELTQRWARFFSQHTLIQCRNMNLHTNLAAACYFQFKFKAVKQGVKYMLSWVMNFCASLWSVENSGFVYTCKIVLLFFFFFSLFIYSVTLCFCLFLEQNWKSSSVTVTLCVKRMGGGGGGGI